MFIMNAIAVTHEFDYSGYAQKLVETPTNLHLSISGAVVTFAAFFGRLIVDHLSSAAVSYLTKKKYGLVKQSIAMDGVNSHILQALKSGAQLHLRPLNHDILARFHGSSGELVLTAEKLIGQLKGRNPASKVAASLGELVAASHALSESVRRFEDLVRMAISSAATISQLASLDKEFDEVLANYGETQFDPALHQMASNAIARAKTRSAAELL
jgi:hypothetical protein